MHSSKPQLMLESFLFFLFCQQLFTSVCFCCFFLLFLHNWQEGGGDRAGGREIENKPNSSLTSSRISIQTRYAVFYMKNKRIVEMFPSCQMEIRGWIGEETTSLHSGSVWSSVWRWAVGPSRRSLFLWHADRKTKSPSNFVHSPCLSFLQFLT